MPDRNPEQLTLFPELFVEEKYFSITTLPEYDLAIENFIKIADMGAFIDLQVSGLDKSYSVSTDELSIPKKYLVTGRHQSSEQFYLLPTALKQELGRIKYEVRSFFNKQNSFKTPLGFFLFRPYFVLWERHRRNSLSRFASFLKAKWSAEEYKRRFHKIFMEGYNFLFTAMIPEIPYEYHAEISVDEIIELKKQLTKENLSLKRLDQDDSEFILKALVLKTEHIPDNLEEYIKSIKIISVFKSIDLQYLKGRKINSLDDLLRLSRELWKDESVD